MASNPEDAARRYASAILGGSPPRKETRIRSHNAWIYETLIAPNTEEWVQTVLPPGRRTAGVRHSGTMFQFDRKDLSTCFSSVPDSGAPFVAACADGGRLVYDVMGVADRSLVDLPLPDRLALAPPGLSVAVYSAHRPTVPNGCSDLGRLVLQRRTGLYSRFKDVATWRPTVGPYMAVLCCRSGTACSFIAGSGCLLHAEQEVVGADKHMGCYVCRWDGRRWTAVREAKRGERIYTTEECAGSRAGVALKDLRIAV
jgi:hypothetical protein